MFGRNVISRPVSSLAEIALGQRLYGRPNHPAGLNYGDCLVYGVAKSESEPRLFKGGDFAKTDVEPALKD